MPNTNLRPPDPDSEPEDIDVLNTKKEHGIYVIEERWRIPNPHKKFGNFVHILASIPKAAETDQPVQLSCMVCSKHTTYYCIGCTESMDPQYSDNSRIMEPCFRKSGVDGAISYGFRRDKTPMTFEERLILIRRNLMRPYCRGNQMTCFKVAHQGTRIADPATL